jgi:hypothetical protein
MNDAHVRSRALEFPVFNFDTPPVLEKDEEEVRAQLRERDTTRTFLPLREGRPDQPRDPHGRFAASLDTVIQVANQSAAANGGFTTSLIGEEALRTGYGVGGATKPLDIHGWKPGHDLAPHIRNFVTANRDKLSQPGHFLGGWHDHVNNVFSLDVAQNVNHRDAALALAAQRGEKAIWDVAANDEIRL